MARDELSELKAFIAVASDSSFTKAAAKLGVSPSALSHTVWPAAGSVDTQLS